MMRLIQRRKKWYSLVLGNNVRYFPCVLTTLLSIYLTPHLCPYKLSSDDTWFTLVVDDPHTWWIQFHINFIEGLKVFAEVRIRVVKEEDDKIYFNKAHDKLQAKQDKIVTNYILKMEQTRAHGRLNQCHIIKIISTTTQNISTNVWTD